MVGFFRKIKTFINIIMNFPQHLDMLKIINVNLIYSELRRLKESKKYADQKCLIRYGHKMYSQNEEDGMIREIFNRIGYDNKVFVEIGVQDGLECNTTSLLFADWKGLWIEGSANHVKQLQERYSSVIDSGRLAIVNSFIDKDNVNAIISSNIKEKEIDLLSIDIDGNDYYIFEAISCISPRVVVIEYNSKFFPPIQYCMKYQETFVWQGDDNFGASLKFLEIKFKEKGYSLVGCDVIGANAFFVRSDVVGKFFLEPFTAENHYESPKYHLSGFPVGHKPCHKTLENNSTF